MQGLGCDFAHLTVLTDIREQRCEFGDFFGLDGVEIVLVGEIFAQVVALAWLVVTVGQETAS